MLLRDALDPYDTIYATTNVELARREGIADAITVPDSNRDVPFRAAWSFLQCCRMVFRLRPSVIITTGALPGLFCIVAGWMLGARTIWIDSIANSDRPSMSGAWALRFATVWLTQWRHLSGVKGGLRYEGSLL